MNFVGAQTLALDSAISLDFSQCADYVHLPYLLYPKEAREKQWTELEYDWRIRHAQEISDGCLNGVYEMLSNRHPVLSKSARERNILYPSSIEGSSSSGDGTINNTYNNDISERKGYNTAQESKELKNNIKNGRRENEEPTVIPMGISNSVLDNWLNDNNNNNYDNDDNDEMYTNTLTDTMTNNQQSQMRNAVDIIVNTGNHIDDINEVNGRGRYSSRTRNNKTGSSLMLKNRLFELRLSSIKKEPSNNNKNNNNNQTKREKNENVSMARIERILEDGPIFEQNLEYRK